MTMEKFNRVVVEYKNLGETLEFDEEPEDDELYELEAIGYTADGKFVLVSLTCYDEPSSVFTDVDMNEQIAPHKISDFINKDGEPVDEEEILWVYVYPIESWEAFFTSTKAL